MAHMDDIKAAEVADKIETIKRDLANFVQVLSTDNEVAQYELLAMELRRLTDRQDLPRPPANAVRPQGAAQACNMRSPIAIHRPATVPPHTSELTRYIL